MILLLRIIFTAIALFFFVLFMLKNFDDRHNAIVYKVYLFVFIFTLQIILNIFNNLFDKQKLSLNSIMETAVNNALLAVIAYDIYGDLLFNGHFNNYNEKQKILVLVILVIGLITTVKLLELLLSQ